MPTSAQLSSVTADGSSRPAEGSSGESVEGHWWLGFSWPSRRLDVRAKELHHLLVVLQRHLGSQWMTMENVLSLLNAKNPKSMVQDLLAGSESRTYRSSTCARCGNSFVRTGPNHKFCLSCKPRAYRETSRKRQRRFRKKTIRVRSNDFRLRTA